MRIFSWIAGRAAIFAFVSSVPMTAGNSATANQITFGWPAPARADITVTTSTIDLSHPFVSQYTLTVEPLSQQGHFRIHPSNFKISENERDQETEKTLDNVSNFILEKYFEPATINERGKILNISHSKKDILLHSVINSIDESMFIEFTKGDLHTFLEKKLANAFDGEGENLIFADQTRDLWTDWIARWVGPVPGPGKTIQRAESFTVLGGDVRGTEYRTNLGPDALCADCITLLWEFIPETESLAKAMHRRLTAVLPKPPDFKHFLNFIESQNLSVVIVQFATISRTTARPYYIKIAGYETRYSDQTGSNEQQLSETVYKFEWR